MSVTKESASIQHSLYLSGKTAGGLLMRRQAQLLDIQQDSARITFRLRSELIRSRLHFRQVKQIWKSALNDVQLKLMIHLLVGLLVGGIS
jgi:hypothetical protein